MSQTFTDDFYAASNVVHTDMQAANANFAALKSAFSGVSSPSDPIAGMFWFDTTSNLLKIRNEANNAWQSVWDFGNNKPVVTNLSDEITGTMIASAIKDPAVDVAGLRTLGTGASQACAGNDNRLLTTEMVVGDNIIGRYDREISCSSYTYIPAVGYTIPADGAYRFSFELKNSPNTSFYAYARIYRNGVAVGTERKTTSLSYVYYSEDISGWSLADECMLYMRRYGTSHVTYVKEFRTKVATATIVAPRA